MREMDQIYDWVRNITYYLIFITVVENLLPSKKYGKYIKFFAGMVLILIVLKPITQGLRLDDTMANYFKTISLKNDAKELTGKISDMEGKRLDQMIKGYEKAVGTDLMSIAESEGYHCEKTDAVIDKDQNSDTFGHVIEVSLILRPESVEGEIKEAASIKSKAVPVEKIKKIDGINITKEDHKVIKKEKNEENSSVSGLRRRIAEYYGLEEQDIEIQMENGEG